MTTQRLFTSLAALFLGLSYNPALAQRPLESTAAASLDTWRSAHGDRWRTFVDEETGRAELLFGGLAPADSTPVGREAWVARALEVVEEARGLLGVAPESLVERDVLELPLARVGTSDKVTVSFTQRVEGLEVAGARVHALFDAQGALLSLQSTAATDLVHGFEPAEFDATAARVAARAVFARRHGVAATRVAETELLAQPILAGDERRVRAAWRVELFYEAPNALPVGEALTLDAVDGSLLFVKELVHQLDVSGTVQGLVTPGTAPDSGSNPEVQMPLPYLRLTSAQGAAVTDSSGAFVFPGVSGPLQVTASFVGDFANVRNDSGAEYSTSPSLQTGGGNSILMNPSAQSLVTAQANAFQAINLLRDWVRSINPNDYHADFVAVANVNLNQNCNAYYNGSSVNFFTSGGGCVNTSYSTVIAHEMGHWLNSRYGTGNGPDGMGEGNADVWAMYLYDTPIVGEGFSNGGYIRSGTNNLQFCGDYGAPCHGGEVHQEGKVWMGAAWKVRDRLNQTLGDALGDDVANALFLGWLSSFNQQEIKEVIETQWILVDDDDGDIYNGSPHYAEIDGGFRQQGWPGVDLVPLTVEDVSVPADSIYEVGPYDVALSIVPHFGQPLTRAELHYRVNGGAWQDFTLLPLPGDSYRALIPDVPSPAVVELWADADDSLGNSVAWPVGGAGAAASFAVGAPAPFMTDFLEGGPGGWTTGTYGDSSNSAVEWEHGFSFGASGSTFDGGTTAIHWEDPTAAHSGFDLWGIDLGATGDGRYANDTHAWLRSPAFDCTGRVGVRLRFQRWASVHRADELSVRVNGALVWTSGDDAHLLDEAWVEQEFDIAALADGNSSVVVEFEIATNGAYRLGGWQVDDVQLLEFGSSPAGCPVPTPFGPAKASSTTETPVLSGLGSPTPGGGFSVRVQHAALGQPAFLFSGPDYALIPFAGAYRLVAAPIVREGNTTTSALGIADFPLAVTGAMVGSKRFYQVWFRDPIHPDGTGLGLSRGLRVDYCP